MIQSLQLKNFRNFDEKTLLFWGDKTFIVGENGKWKTNTLEALSLLTGNSITWVDFENLVKDENHTFFISYNDDEGNTIGISFNVSEKKKHYIINSKKVSKKKFLEHTKKSVIFSPIIMNLMYLSPSLRRDFLDHILKNTYEWYDKVLKDYKKALKHRNKVLKNIREHKSERSEIEFWDNEFIKKAEEIYGYRFKIIKFFEKHIESAKEYFSGKIKDIQFIYETKINEWSIREDITKNLQKNFERDIILWTTHIGPHIDDFDIIVDKKKLIEFASRWETKSIIIWLKLLETAFVEKISKKKPILLIDDLLSELDEKHKSMLIERMKYYQTFITSIHLENQEENLITL
jgi:DNA replication and repair protein RecF